MRLAGLLSGGKDSVYASRLAQLNHHTLAYLVSLRSLNPDSYMFHTVNINLTELQAEAWNIPYVESETQGVKEEELQDLKKTLESLDVDGVITGAIASRYQGERIDKLCSELCLHHYHPLWGMDREKFVPPDIATCFEAFGRTMLPPGLFGFLAAWWPLRHAPNVLLLHFSDMKRDHEGSVRRIGEFLGFTPSAEQWPRILEYTSFPWMKRHEHKFEIRHAAQVPVLDSGAMVRKGKTGAAEEDGVTPEMSAELKALGQGMLADRQALDWLYKGGALP